MPTDDGQKGVSLVPRLLVSLLLGLLVFAISCHVAYRQFCGSSIRYVQSLTLRDIQRIGDAVEEHRQQEGVLPKALSDLSDLNAILRVDERGLPVNVWFGRQRFNYWTDGTHYRISSYGHDGKPGGVGLDCDLSTDDLPKADQDISGLPQLPQKATPTFRQFVTHRGEYANSGSGRAMALLSVLAGAVAFVLGFRTLGRSEAGRPSTWRLVLNLVVTTGATLLIGLLIVGFHVPSGH